MHQDGNNYVFADGHAQWLKLSQTRYDWSRDGSCPDWLWVYLAPW